MAAVRREALFAGLVYNEEGQPAEVVYIGGEPYYAVPDGEFLRHVESEYVDRQIVGVLQERVTGMRDVVAEGVMEMLGEKDLFTRASIEHTIENLDHILEPGTIDVDELRTALWMTGFRAIVDVHGDVLHLNAPGWTGDETE